VSVEREKRLRVEVSDQFRDLASEGTHSAIDPKVEPDRGLVQISNHLRSRRKKTSLETFLGK